MLKPYLILPELTTRCNLNCVFCNHHHRKHLPQYGGTPQDMDFDFYKEIVDKTAAYSEIIHPNGCAEPLLYPHIVEAVEYANKKNKITKFFTNAMLLDEKMTMGLLEAGLTEIMFSVDGCDKRSYEPFRVGASWDTVLKNIKYFIKAKNKGGYKTKPIVRITATPELALSLKAIKRFWSKLGLYRVRSTRELAIPPPSEILDADLNPRFSSGVKFECSKLNRHLTVTVTGKLVVCCVDYLGAYIIGDLTKQEPLEAFNSEEANKLRNAMKTGINFPTLCECCQTPKGYEYWRPMLDLSTYDC